MTQAPSHGSHESEVQESKARESKAQESQQLLHLVFGGELTSLESNEFRDPAKIDVVGIFPDFASAERAWRGKAQSSVDSAQTRYFIVHLHRFLSPKGLARKASDF